MSSELQLAYTAAAANLYAIIRSAVGTVVKTSDGTLVAYVTANLSQYTIAMTEQGTASQYYTASVPASTPAGSYNVVVYLRAGGSAAEGDTPVGGGLLEWDGSAVVSLYSRLAPATAGRTLVVDSAGLADANVVKIGPSGSGVATTANLCTNLKTIFDTDYATVYDATNKAFLAKLGNFAMGGSSLALTTGAIACTTITASGAVAFQSTFAVTGTTTLTGAVTASNASNNIVGIDVAKINGVATTSVTTVNANVGTTQPLNFTGTGASALVKSDMVDIAGAAVSTSTAQIGVNVVNYGGSPGTFSGGRPEVKLGNVAHGGVAGTLTLERIIVASTTTDQPAVSLTGNGAGAGLYAIGGNGGNGATFLGGAVGASYGVEIGGGGSGGGSGGTGLYIYSYGAGNGMEIDSTGGYALLLNASTLAALEITTSAASAHAIEVRATGAGANGLDIRTTNGHGVYVQASGSSKHGAILTGGTGGTSDGLKCVAGTGGVPIRGDITGNITGTVSGNVGGIASGGIAAASFAAGAIDAAAIATNAIDADALAADAVTEIWSKAMTELASVPGVTGTVLQALSFVFELARNKITQTSTTQTLRNAADDASIGTATVADDGSTFTRGAWS